MDNMLYFQEALGSLIDLVPEPRKVERKTHSVELLYDTSNSSVSSAWADCASHISKAYDVLLTSELEKTSTLKTSTLNSYITYIDIGESLSLKDISKLINESKQHSNLALMKNFAKIDISK